MNKTRLMKRTIILLISLLGCIMIDAQVPQGFNYQAIARDGSGNPIINTSLQVKLAVMADSLGTNIYWEELFNSVTTNAFGLFTVIMGRGVRQATSTVATFSSINWKITPVFIRTQIYYLSAWKNMGSTRFWSVPFALVSNNAVTANGLAGALPYLNVSGNTTVMDSALFAVRNNKGQVIFAVYNEGVRIYVDDGLAKGTNKGGFAIGSFGTSKAPSQDFLRVTRDSTRVYVNQNAKGTKGGFAIGGFAGKGDPNNYLNLTPYNYFIGQNSGSNISTGIYNAFLGYEAGRDNTTGTSNIFIGYSAGTANKDGNSNLFIGTMSGKSNINGSNNVFLGNQSGTANTGGVQGWMGSNNILIGFGAGASNTTGGSNIFIGTYAGMLNDVGTLNIYIGDHSGENAKGVRNTFIGLNTGQQNSTGNDNIFIGTQSGQSSTSGDGNTVVGSLAGWQTGTGAGNTYMGYSSGASATNGNNNLFAGYQAGASTGSGSQNVYLGYSAGAWAAGSGNVFIGNQAGNSETASNRLYIDNYGNSSINALIYGEFDNHILNLNAKVNIRDGLHLVPLSSPPANPSQGDIYFNGTTKKLMVWDGTAWQACW